MSSDLKKQLKQSALALLSRREYSFHELQQRLLRIGKKGQDPMAEDDGSALVEGAIDELLREFQRLDYQSDQRFAESLLRSRIGRGQGAIRIAQELRYKGVADDLRSQVLEACEQDWFELASEVLQRRFGSRPPVDRREQAKWQRFLLYRGFTQEQCRYAMDQVSERA